MHRVRAGGPGLGFRVDADPASATRRLTSNIFPWCTEYALEDLPGFAAIADELAFAGKLARAYDQRLTFHPSHFVKLAAEGGELLGRSMKELEVHAQVGATAVSLT